MSLRKLNLSFTLSENSQGRFTQIFTIERETGIFKPDLYISD